MLTGLPAGVRDAAGRFPAGSLFGRVERRIIELAERLRHAEHPQPESMPGETAEGHDDGAHESMRVRLARARTQGAGGGAGKSTSISRELRPRKNPF